MSASAAVIGARGPLISTGPRDYNHAVDDEYQRLRSLADQAFQKKQSLSQESQEAYQHGDGAKAHQLSEKAKVQQRVAEKYNLEAAEYVFVQNNADSGSNEIDLHGLYVKEALWILQKRISAGIKGNEPYVRVIVGKGKHSQNGIAKIKFAVEDLCKEANLKNYLDSKNSGVLVIELQGAHVPPSWDNADYNTYAHGAAEKPQQSQYNGQGVYQAAQQPQYYAQQSSQQHQQTSSSDNNLPFIFKLFCTCFSFISSHA